MTQTKLAEFHRHIDNGGISVTISDNDVHGVKWPTIELQGQYFGYPAVKATMSNSMITSQDLFEIAEAFYKAALQLKQQNR